MSASPADDDNMEQLELPRELARQALAVNTGSPIPMPREAVAIPPSDSEDEPHTERNNVGSWVPSGAAALFKG